MPMSRVIKKCARAFEGRERRKKVKIKLSGMFMRLLFKCQARAQFRRRMWASQLVYGTRKNPTELVVDLTRVSSKCARSERDCNRSSTRQKEEKHSQLRGVTRRLFFPRRPSERAYVNHGQFDCVIRPIQSVSKEVFLFFFTLDSFFAGF